MITDPPPIFREVWRELHPDEPLGPKRVPGAHVPRPGPAPEGGWFGTWQWPTDDPDTAAAVRYLRNCGLPDGPAADALLRHVLNGLHRL